VAPQRRPAARSLRYRRPGARLRPVGDEAQQQPALQVDRHLGPAGRPGQRPGAAVETQLGRIRRIGSGRAGAAARGAGTASQQQREA
jgi:hypothetical protein